jgi:hypothetical protein
MTAGTPGYWAVSNQGTALAGHNAALVLWAVVVVAILGAMALGAEALGAVEFIVYPELWDEGGHMGVIFHKFQRSQQQALLALWMLAAIKILGNKEPVHRHLFFLLSYPSWGMMFVGSPYFTLFVHY